MSADISIKVDLGNLPQAIMVDKGQLALHAGVEAINLAGPFVARKLAENTPDGATGKARQSVTFEPAKVNGFGPLTGFVGYGAPASLYIGFANDGTRPHFPPVTPLTYWAARKLGNARLGYAMAKHIAIYGTRAQFFVEDTRDEVEDPAIAMMRARFLSFFEALGG